MLRTCKTEGFLGEGQQVKGFLTEHKDTPWERGQHDCVLFIQKYTSEVWGKPYAEPEDYPFHDFKTAVKALFRICRDSNVKTFEGVLDKYYYRTSFPVEGGIVAKPDTEGLTGYSYGVCHDGYGYFVGENGLVLYELNPLTDLFWSID